MEALNCPFCDLSKCQDVRNLYRTLKNFQTQLFQCPQCPDQLNGVNAFLEHLEQNHVNVKQCSKCNLNFDDAIVLETHQKLVHGNDFRCHKCQKVFKIKASLIIHLKVAHNESSADNISNKCWQCLVCKKSFTTKYFLKKHRRLHTGNHFEIGYLFLKIVKFFFIKKKVRLRTAANCVKNRLLSNNRIINICNIIVTKKSTRVPTVDGVLRSWAPYRTIRGFIPAKNRIGVKYARNRFDKKFRIWFIKDCIRVRCLISASSANGNFDIRFNLVFVK